MNKQIMFASTICRSFSKQITDSYYDGSVLKGVYYVISDWFFELRYNIRTKCFLDKAKYDEPHPDSIEYVGARYVQLNDIFNSLPIKHSDCSLLDIGCGKGRAIAVAATYSFIKIIGIEYDQQLALSGQQNIRRMRNKMSNDVEIFYGDAITYTIPKEINIIYMFNPFMGETLKQVINNIQQSYNSEPRKIYIIFLNHDHFDNAIKHHNWITKISTFKKVDGVTASLYATL